MPIEFVDSPPEAPDEAAAVLPGRSSGAPRWLTPLVVIAVAALALFVLVRNTSTDKHPVAIPSPAPVTPTAPRPPSTVEQTLLAIYERGHAVAPAQTVVRDGSGSGTCELVRVGSSPQRAASRALVQRLPGYRIVDTARIIDQSAGLCGLQVRARDKSGNNALIIVTSPSPGSPSGRTQGLEAHAGPLKRTFVEYAQLTTGDGWTAIVGVSGPQGRQPSTRVLGELASSPALRW